MVLALGGLLAACGGDSRGGGDGADGEDVPDGDAQEAQADQDGMPDPLRVGLIPNVAPDEQRARYQPFGDYLETELGVEVELFVASNYAGVVTALASDQLDVAYLGGLTYLQAQEQIKLEPLVTEEDRETGTSRYISAIIVRSDSAAQDVDDLLGQEASFAFGDVSSTSSSLYPRIMLVEAGAECSVQELDSCPPLSEISFTGGHDAVAQAVLAGQVDAGGLERRILNRLISDGAVPEGELRIVEEAEVEGYPWVARLALGEETLETITEAFLDIEDPELLDLLRAERYLRVEREDYEDMRTRADELGLLAAG